MSYCTLEEAWGPDFKKQKRKSRKEKKLEKEGQKMLHESVDPQILIPETSKMADYRKDVIQYPMSLPDKSGINGYDSSFDSYISPYQRYATDPVQKTNEQVLSVQQSSGSSLISEVEKPVEKLIQITKQEYDNLKKEVVEGFTNQTDEQFNQLLLYIFTGIFYLFMLDMMYQLGKKSY